MGSFVFDATRKEVSGQFGEVVTYCLSPDAMLAIDIGT